MRIHPIALLAWCTNSHWETTVEKASSLTHAHERSKLACKIYTLILFSLLDNPCKDSVKIALSEAMERYKTSTEYKCYSRLFSYDFEKLPKEKIKSSGYVVDTLEAAIWCVLTTNTYRECVLKAVNLGDDTDTVAAVAGGLAGALYGYDGIPKEWIGSLKRKNYIEKICEQSAKNWDFLKANQ